MNSRSKTTRQLQNAQMTTLHQLPQVLTITIGGQLRTQHTQLMFLTTIMLTL
jgi:hypothetical protein